MIRRLLFYLFLFLLAWLGGFFLKNYPQEVIIAYSHWTVQIPVWLIFILAVTLFLILHFFLHLISTIRNWPQAYRNWVNRRQSKRSYSGLEKGFMQFLSGHFQLAEEIWLATAKKMEDPVLGYLAAACAASEQQERVRQIYYCQKAVESSKEEENWPLQLLFIRALMQNQQFDEASLLLKRLARENKEFPTIMALKDFYLQKQDWDSLIKLLPLLHRKASRSDQLELKKLEAIIRAHFLQLESGSLEAVTQLWKSIPREIRSLPQVLIAYSQQLIRLKQPDSAAELLMDQLDKTWDPLLIEFFGHLPIQNAEKLLHHGERWLKDHPKDSVLLLALGRLAAHSQYTSKAEEYLLASLGVNPSAEAYFELGRMYESNGLTSKALAVYQKGLLQCVASRKD